jgi:hypothetical protein
MAQVSSLIRLIDDELRTNAGIRSGLSAYATLAKRLSQTGDVARLLWGVLDHAAAAYRRGGNDGSDLVTLDDGAASFLFDITHGRTVLCWGVTKAVAANSRDDAYHAGFPRAGKGLDKGHAWSHAQGGREGGPNYFRQARSLNQGRSRNGKLWRQIEIYLAANAGLPAFIRLIYRAANTTDLPDEVEYGLITKGRQFRVVVFPNASHASPVGLREPARSSR